MFKRQMSDFHSKNMKHRKQYSEICDFITSENKYYGKILALYGLRRTGKSVLMEQAMYFCSRSHKCAYYEAQENDDMQNVYDVLNKEQQNGTEVVFIDEITRVSDFSVDSSLLADVFSKMGMKIIVAGTDSLGFDCAEKDTLFDRVKRIHTTYISFAEHCDVLDTNDIDTYIQYGGLMQKGQDEESVHDYYSACKYLNSAVAGNIINSLKKGFSNSELNILTYREMCTVIEKLVELYSGQFNAGVMTSDLKKVVVNWPINKMKEENIDDSIITGLIADRSNITRKFLPIINADASINHRITESMVSELEQILFDINVLSTTENVPFRKIDGEWRQGVSEKGYYIIQPAIKYNHLEKGIEFVEQNESFAVLSSEQKEWYCRKLEEKIKGDMTEQIVIFDVSSRLDKKRYYVCKPDFYINGSKKGEYDMLVYDKSDNSYYAFEIKHTTTPEKTQAKHLENSDFEEIINRQFGNKKNVSVLYRGDSFESSTGTFYLNITEFMKSIDQTQNIDIVFEKLTKGLKETELKDSCFLNIEKSEIPSENDSSNISKTNTIKNISDDFER